MYKCKSVLNEHRPPDYSVQDTSSNCDNATDGTLCMYNCQGRFKDEVYTLDEQTVRLYELSPTEEYFPTVYKCIAPLKYILRAHGVLLPLESRVTLSDPTSNFTLFTYIEQGQCLSADFQIGCDDRDIDGYPHEYFTEEFYEIEFSDEFDVSGINAEMGLVECLGNDVRFLRNKDITTLISGYKRNQPNYRNNISYYSLHTIHGFESIHSGFGLQGTFKLSELVQALKIKHPGREIHLHLATCLSTNDVFIPQPSDIGPILLSRWENTQLNRCGDLPQCEILNLNPDTVNDSECTLGESKSIMYSDEIPYTSQILEASTCNLSCMPGHSEITTSAPCMTYQTMDGTNSTRYLNIEGNTLNPLDINCLPLVHNCSADL
jgi:hypothetical protein